MASLLEDETAWRQRVFPPLGIGLAERAASPLPPPAVRRPPLARLLAAGAWPVLLLAALAGCGSIPRFVPDLGPTPPVVLDSAHGPLSPARSRAVLERLRQRSPDSDVLGRHLAIEQEITGSSLTTGNRVTLLRDGPDTYQAMFEAIGSATRRIDLETYILDDDAVGRRFADALAARRREGVEVHLIHDAVGTLKTPSSFFQALKDAGVQVVEFNPVNPLKAARGWRINHRDHRKLLVVDGHVAFLGGINISGVYSSSGSGSGGSSGGGSGAGSRPAAAGTDQGWRDTDVRIEGPAVAELERLFEGSWTSQGGPALPPPPPVPAAAPGKDIVRAVGSAPGDPWPVMFNALLSAIDSAESTVHLTNAYFVPDPQLMEALQAAARRGVDVSLVLPSRTDSWLVTAAGRHAYEPLLAAGVKIHERRGAMLHAKTAVIDGVWATVGSTNLDWRSALHNQEVDAIVLGPAFAGQLEDLFRQDLAVSDEVTLAAWRRRGVKERLSESFAHAWAWWL